MASNFGFGHRKVDASRFSMVPRSDVPRSTFASQHTHKTTFEADDLVPIYLDEVLPGDSVKLKMTAFIRMQTPLFPVMDNLHLDTFFFFVPNRLVWENWVKMMGERADPDDSIDYLTPMIEVPLLQGYGVGSLADYFGIPPNELADGGYEHSALPFRAYSLIWNEWFRDENLQDRVPIDLGDGPDSRYDHALKGRGKRHDYFTSALPWPQKGDAVTLPLGTRAPISGLGVASSVAAVDATGTNILDPTQQGTGIYDFAYYLPNPSGAITDQVIMRSTDDGTLGIPDVYADLSEATAATINSIRQAFQIQKLLERDARGGTRYTEILQAHFGVSPQDSRLQRPEYLGGGSSPINITPVAQTSATGLTGGNSPLGALGAVGMSVANHGFSGSFQEHGFIIGLLNVRADLTYQQGLHKMWSRRTRYDYYWPVFSHLGEQAILRQEIYLTDDEESNSMVFGYQERWAEYRHKPSRISGWFRSGISGTYDSWHLAQFFATPPVLGEEFIEEAAPLERILAAGSLPDQEFLCDALFDVKMVRPMPVYSVPGFIDRF